MRMKVGVLIGRHFFLEGAELAQYQLPITGR